MSEAEPDGFLDKAEQAMNNGEEAVAQPGPDMAAGQASPGGEPNIPSKEYIEQITKIELPDQLIHHLQIFMTQDWIMANLPEAGVWETKWLARAATKRILSSYPRPDCPYEPEYQAAVFGVDIDDCYQPLTTEQRRQFIDLAELVYPRVTRGEEGFQQEEMSKNYQVNKNENNQQQQQRKNRFWSLFG